MKKLIVTIGLVSSLFGLGFESNNLCFKSRNYPLSYDIVFESMKQTLLDANMHLKEISKKDGFISAEGTKKYDDSMYKFDFTISFDKKGDITSIKTIVSYDLIKKESEVKGITQFNIPIPIPWSKVFRYKGTTNVDNPQFFDSFYTSFDMTSFEYQMKKLAVSVKKTEDKLLRKDLGELQEKAKNKPIKQKETPKTPIKPINKNELNKTNESTFIDYIE